LAAGVGAGAAGALRSARIHTVASVSGEYFLPHKDGLYLPCWNWKMSASTWVLANSLPWCSHTPPQDSRKTRRAWSVIGEHQVGDVLEELDQADRVGPVCDPLEEVRKVDGAAGPGGLRVRVLDARSEHDVKEKKTLDWEIDSSTLADGVRRQGIALR
jgi:hypothetical protein